MNERNLKSGYGFGAQFWHVRYAFILTFIGLAALLLLDWPFYIRLALAGVVLAGLVVALTARIASPDRVEETQEKRDSRQIITQDTGRDTKLSVMSGERLAELLTDPMILFDDGGSVIYANRAALDAFQPLEKDATLYLRFRAPEMHALIQGVIADGNPRSIDYFERVPIDRWYKAMVKPLADDKGRPEYYVLVFRDQSETRRIDRMRSDFIANASHELRTPLASLRGFIETLQGPARNDVAARERFLEIMQKQADRMSRLIDDLLSLSRLEMRAHLAVSETVDLSNVFNHVIDSLSPLASGLGVTIERHLPEHPVKVIGARDELIQVFQNLIENACKYGQEGKRIVVSLEETYTDGLHEAVASIQDFGPGISSEHLPRLTERFYRIDVETSRAQKGTGLGLAIVKHILARHRGRLVVRSQLGEGSTFIVRLNAVASAAVPLEAL